MYLFEVRYYTLSDGHARKEIAARTSAEAIKSVRQQDDTFDQVESIGTLKELCSCEWAFVRPDGICERCGLLHISPPKEALI
jgi:hypothetical protein